METGKTQRNILLIMCDQLRPDFLSAYGGSCIDTPNLDALAAGGTVFDNAITAWCKLPKATAERCAMVKKYADKLGVWLLHDEEDRRLAQAFGADIIETTGSLKP